MLLFKPEAQIRDATFYIGYALGVASSLHEQLFHRPAVVTSIHDGVHGEHSKHYEGNAVDLRTRDLSPALRELWAAGCSKALDKMGFDIVLEHSPDHLHIEWDPKKEDRFITAVDAEAEAASAAGGK